MTEEEANAPSSHATPDQPRRAGEDLREHEVRRALLDLLAEVGTITATEAAKRLGYSSGLCSFHLRQLARYGHIEEAPHAGGRARPWRVRRATPPPAADSPTEGFGELARGLEDESYQRWLVQRDQAPDEWRQDEAFSAVVYLTPEEMSAVAEAIRQTLARYQDREQQPAARPRTARPVALIARLFPLLPDALGEED
ncbi:MAG: ArsR family transcriptional regulator [Streptomyces oryziradicis]|nr:ArsR family transcriptional regulator [Actinacidiphila oryziradicis]